MKANQILLKPILSEKSSMLGEKENKYAFVVNLKANKNQIREAVENYYDVKVIKVWTTINAGKTKRAGKTVTKKSSSKKALILIDKGQKIEFFKGV